MVRLFAGILLVSVAAVQVSFASQSSGQNDLQNSDQKTIIQAPPPAPASLGNASKLPPPPAGRSTVEGGTIRSVDPVRDQLILNVYGTKPIKVLFDERTLVYRDGAKAKLSDLRAQDHASIETVLDGTKIFAVSIHMLSKAPEGECQGQVVSFNAGTGQLTVSAALSRQSITLHVPAGTPIVGVGQISVSSPSAGLADLVPGALITATFDSNNNGHGVARQISILATPGASFVFTGNVVSLDLGANRLVLTDPKDDQTYTIVFDRNRLPMSQDLHVGSRVTVTANFDGTHYVATAAKII